MADQPIKQPNPGGGKPGPGGRSFPVEPGLMDRVSAGLKWMFGAKDGVQSPAAALPLLQASAQSHPQSSPQPPAVRQPDPWMGPGTPMAPSVLNPDDVAGREMDYPVGANTSTRPRRSEAVSFEMLEGLYESLDLVKLCVETRKDQFGNLTWSCLPKQEANDTSPRKPDARCTEIEAFFRRPDGRLAYAQWARELVHDQLVFDAPALYVRRTLGGDVYSLEVVKGSYIDVKLDKTGRVPKAPDTAYQHILKGLPAINYTVDELVYWPRNLRSGHRYGFGPVEQLLMSINIAVRREVEKLNYFTEGNVPEAIIGCPETWTPEVIARWQAIWDSTMSDQTVRRRARFVPGKMSFQPTRSDESLSATGDEWWARIICYAFSLPPLPFVKQQNRATAETAKEEALSEGLQPMMLWFKSLIDHLIQDIFGYKDLEMVWDDTRDIDPAQQDPMDLQQINIGRLSIDESRISRGLQPIGMTHAIWGIGPAGIMFVDDLLALKKQGLLRTGMANALSPPAPDAMGMPGAPLPPGAVPPGQGPPGLHPAAASAIAGVDPKLLAAVGLGAGGSAGRSVDVTAGEAFESDPLSRHVSHPQILQTLREAEQRQGRTAP
jgi:hypothetical protein